MSSPEELVRVGLVVKPHGIRGEIVVKPEGDTLGLLPLPARVGVGDPPVERVLERMRPHGGRLLVTLEGIEDRTAAETLRGAWLRLGVEQLAEPEEATAYVDELVGCRLESERGDSLGVVRGIVHGAGQDLLEVETDGGEMLVPMVRDWLLELDPKARRIRMRLPEGLVDG